MHCGVHPHQEHRHESLVYGLSEPDTRRSKYFSEFFPYLMIYLFTVPTVLFSAPKCKCEALNIATSRSVRFRGVEEQLVHVKSAAVALLAGACSTSLF